MLEDIYQSCQISRNRDLATSARDKSQSSARDVYQLERKVEKLMMLTEALWGVIKKEHDLKDDDLERMLEEIDLKDGKLNYKVAKTGPVKCEKCRKTIQNGLSKCMYCGTRSNKSVFKR